MIFKKSIKIIDKCNQLRVIHFSQKCSLLCGNTNTTLLCSIINVILNLVHHRNAFIMVKKSDFFNEKNIISSDTVIDYNQIKDYLEPLKALSRSIYSNIYIIDYHTQGFDYVSENPLFLCGNTADEVKEMGFEFYLKYVPKEEHELLLKINEVGLDFYHTLPVEDRKKYSLSYDFHLINADSDTILINQKITPLFLTKDNMVWKALCIVNLSPAKEPGNIKIFKDDENLVFKYDLDSKQWTKSERVSLTNREKEILSLSARGFTIDKISKMIFVSPDTVKFHKRKLFKKIGVANISEAIFFAVNNKLI